jgi:hypothetical protein
MPYDSWQDSLVGFTVLTLLVVVILLMAWWL